MAALSLLTAPSGSVASSRATEPFFFMWGRRRCAGFYQEFAFPSYQSAHCPQTQILRQRLPVRQAFPRRQTCSGDAEHGAGRTAPRSNFQSLAASRTKVDKETSAVVWSRDRQALVRVHGSVREASVEELHAAALDVVQTISASSRLLFEQPYCAIVGPTRNLACATHGIFARF